jgi:phosphatidate cytidylyltransferase
MLVQRLLTAAVGIPIILGVIYLGGWLFTGVVAAILAIAAMEFVHMAQRESRPLWRPSPAAIVAAVGVAAIAIGADSPWRYWELGDAIIAAVAGSLLFVIAFRRGDAALNEWMAIVAALLYVGYLGSHIVFLRRISDFPFPVTAQFKAAYGLPIKYDDGQWVFLAVVSTWGADTCAYAVGKLIGRHKMAPSISPGKTWEGTIGGLIGGLVVVVALNRALDLPLSTGQAVLLGLMLPVVAVLADLGESKLKRAAGVKDTSALVPGHGGFLDRLDSLLFTVPLVYYFAVWIVL